MIGASETGWIARIRSLPVPMTACLGMAIVTVYAVIALFAPWIAPHSQSDIVGPPLQPMGGGAALLGTDTLGRDILSRLIYGARNTIGLALATTTIACTLGVFLGILAAVSRGWVDAAISRSMDVVMSIPDLIFALLLLMIFGISELNMVLVIASLDATRFFRLARGLAVEVRALEYVEVARLRGEGAIWITIKEILPNILPPIFVECGIRFVFVFLFVSALGFLGLGVQPPLADWGSMVREMASLINYGRVTPVIPAAMIAVLAVGVNLVADWLLDLRNADQA